MSRQNIPLEWQPILDKVSRFDQMKVALEAIQKVCQTRHLGFACAYFRSIEDMATEALAKAQPQGGKS